MSKIYSSYKINASTKLFMPLNGRSIDISGAGNHGTDTAIRYIRNKYGVGARFDGASSIITFPDCPTTGNGSFTMRALIKGNVFSSANCIMGFGTGNTSQGITFDVRNSVLHADFYASSSIDGTTVLKANKEYVVTLVFNGSEIRLFINGIFEATTGGGVTANIVDGSGALGRAFWAAGNYFDGDIFIPVMENKAWTATEVLNDAKRILALTNVKNKSFLFALVSTTTNQAITATTAITASIIKQMSKSLTVTSTSTTSFIRSVTKGLIVTATGTASIIKQMAKALTVTSTVTASLLAIRVYLQALTATTTVTGVITKIPGKLLSVTSTSTASIIKALSINLTVSATANVIVTLTKQINKTLESLSTITGSITKIPGKLLSTSTTVTATIDKLQAKILTATTTVSGVITAARAVILSATTTPVATITKTPGKLLSITLTITAKIIAPFWRTKYPPHGDDDDYNVKYPHD